MTDQARGGARGVWLDRQSYGRIKKTYTCFPNTPWDYHRTAEKRPGVVPGDNGAAYMGSPSWQSQTGRAWYDRSGQGGAYGSPKRVVSGSEPNVSQQVAPQDRSDAGGPWTRAPAVDSAVPFTKASPAFGPTKIVSTFPS